MAAPPAPDETPDAEFEALKVELAEVAPDLPAAVIRVLAKSFLGTKKKTHQCPHCNRMSHVTIEDSSAALKAVGEFMDRAKGRPGLEQGSGGPAIVVRVVRPRDATPLGPAGTPAAS